VTLAVPPKTKAKQNLINVEELEKEVSSSSSDGYGNSLVLGDQDDKSSFVSLSEVKDKF
jgi:hypothetical protein